jgi:hypothetical protein
LDASAEEEEFCMYTKKSAELRNLVSSRVNDKDKYDKLITNDRVGTALLKDLRSFATECRRMLDLEPYSGVKSGLFMKLALKLKTSSGKNAATVQDLRFLLSLRPFLERSKAESEFMDHAEEVARLSFAEDEQRDFVKGEMLTHYQSFGGVPVFCRKELFDAYALKEDDGVLSETQRCMNVPEYYFNIRELSYVKYGSEEWLKLIKMICGEVPNECAPPSPASPADKDKKGDAGIALGEESPLPALPLARAE